MKIKNKDIQAIIEGLAQTHHNPIDFLGKTWTGDIDYTAISLIVGINQPSAFNKVCEGLKSKGFYVHN